MNQIEEIIKNQNEYFGNEVEDKYDLELDDDTDVVIDAVNGDVLDTQIFTSHSGLQLESIVNSLKTDYFQVPGFQRQFVWTKNQVAALAFSILKGIPIPPLYLYVDSNTKKHIILDGQQRVTAIFLYYYGLFFSSENNRKKINYVDVAQKKERIDSINQELSDLREKESIEKEKIICLEAEKEELLKFLKDNYELVETGFEIIAKGKPHDLSFQNFKKDSRDFLLRKDFQIVVVRCLASRPQKVYAEIFKSLNKGGKILGTQEVRNGIYWDTRLYVWLTELNKNLVWRSIYGRESIYSKDTEILLKMLALNYFTQVGEPDKDGNIVTISYNGTFNWSNIINEYSEQAISFTDEVFEKETKRLERFLDVIEFDDEKIKCNKAAFEAVFVALCKCGKLESEGELVLKMSWIHEIEKTEIFEKVLSNRLSVVTRLSKTLIEVEKEYATT